MLIIGGVLHALGEILTSGGGFSLSFELAEPAAPGAYQGAYGTGQAFGMMLGPVLVTTVIDDAGTLGWLLYTAGYGLLGLVGWTLTRTVVRTTDRDRGEAPA